MVTQHFAKHKSIGHGASWLVRCSKHAVSYMLEFKSTPLKKKKSFDQPWGDRGWGDNE